jgi:alditol oxidase
MPSGLMVTGRGVPPRLLRSWVGNASERGGTVALELTNWAGNLAYSADSVHYPTSIVEVQELVARLPRVKALGTRHSFNGIADAPEGALISLSELAPEVSIDADAMTVSVTGGTRYGSLAAELQSQGYALHNTGSLPHISVAGATATGTHGSGDRNGILSTAVSAVELVKSDGSLVTVDRSNPDLKALAVGLGAFGIVTRLVLDIQPTYLVRQDVYRNAPWDTVLDAFDEVMASAYSVSLIGDFGSPVIRELWQKARVKTVSDGHQEPEPVPETLHGGTWYDDAEEPAGHSLTVRAGMPGPWSERLPHFRLDAPPSAGGDELQTEYFVDRRHAVNALRTLRSLGDRISLHLHATEIRTAAADDLWLSPAYERDSLCIGFTWRKHPTEVLALLADIEAALAPYEPRPHWGKLFVFNDELLARRFPRLPEFLELTTTYDPTGKFSNAFIEALQP